MENREYAKIYIPSTIEFSQNFNVENQETTPETNFKIFLMINIQGFCDKEILRLF